MITSAELSCRFQVTATQLRTSIGSISIPGRDRPGGLAVRLVNATDSHGKMQSPNKSRHRLSEADASHLLRRCADDQFVTTLQEVLKQYRIDGWLTISQAAALAGLSVRSFQRKLNQQGVAYTRLSEATKVEIAIQRLRCTNQSLSEIASELGYTARTNFIRAFKRWTGLTPEQFRGDSTRSIEIRLMRDDRGSHHTEKER